MDLIHVPKRTNYWTMVHARSVSHTRDSKGQVKIRLMVMAICVVQIRVPLFRGLLRVVYALHANHLREGQLKEEAAFKILAT